MKRGNRMWLIVLLGVVVILGVWLYFSLLSSLFSARMELKESRAQGYKEIKEKQLLQEELRVIKEQLQSNIEELRKVTIELENTQKELNIVNEKLSGTEKENQSLQEEKNRLEAKLHSLKGLKEAIRQVKIEIHEQKVKRQREIDAEGLTGGNRGFLIKDGQSQYRPSIKIEVNPAN